MSAKDAWSKWAKTYDIQEETLSSTQDAIDRGYKPFHEITLEEARHQVEEIFQRLDEGEFHGSIEEMGAPSTNEKVRVPITVFRPYNIPPTSAGIFIYFHGGGLVMVTSRMRNYVARSIAMKARVIVVNVDYRLLPCAEDSLAPFNDAEAVTRWVLENKVLIGGDATSKVGVGGDSAGGQLAICVTHCVPGLDFQVLVYPVTDLALTGPSFVEFRDIPAFNGKAMEAMLDYYVPFIPDAAQDPRVNPSCRRDFQTSPPTLVLLAELDPLRDQGRAFVGRLRDAGVKVEEVMYKGLCHGFFARSSFRKTSQQAHNDVASFIKSVVGF